MLNVVVPSSFYQKKKCSDTDVLTKDGIDNVAFDPHSLLFFEEIEAFLPQFAHDSTGKY